MVTRYGQADVPREVSGRRADRRSAPAADFPRDVCLTVSRNHAVFLFYPVHGANLTLIRPMWSAYPYAPTSLYGIHMPLLPYMVIQPIVLGMALLWAAIDSALSQGPLLWRHNDMTVIVSRNTRGRERDTRQRLDNANARRLQTVNR